MSLCMAPSSIFYPAVQDCIQGPSCLKSNWRHAGKHQGMGSQNRTPLDWSDQQTLICIMDVMQSEGNHVQDVDRMASSCQEATAQARATEASALVAFGRDFAAGLAQEKVRLCPGLLWLPCQ